MSDSIDWSNINPDSIPELLVALQDFQEKYPEVRYLERMILVVKNKANFYMSHFIEMNPTLQGKKLYLYGQRTFFPNRHICYEEFKNPDERFNNVVYLLNDEIVVDFSNRQWDMKGAIFKIDSLDSFKKDWLVVFSNIEVMESFTQIESCLLQSTEEWQKKAYPSSSDRQITDHVAENKTSAIKHYREVLKFINEGLMSFTGTEKDNLWLQKMNGEYKQKIKEFCISDNIDVSEILISN